MQGAQEEPRAFEAWVSGRVQGVGFRWRTQRRAEELGLAGWVRNLVDGRVHVWVEGPADAVDSMEAWLRRGPGGARVDELEIRERGAAGLDGFAVRATGA